jgi:hypothetical protein
MLRWTIQLALVSFLLSATTLLVLNAIEAGWLSVPEK